MRIKEKALAKINTPAVRRELSGELDCTEQTIIRYIKRNENNGPLTTIGALSIVEKMTGLKQEQIIEP